MIKHIVLMKLKHYGEGKTKAENALLLQERLEGLNGRIPGALRFEVGITITDTEGSVDGADVVLYSEFKSREALAIYSSHPEHEKVKSFAQAIRTERRVIDYEV